MPTPTTTGELLDQVVALGLCDADRITGTFPADRPLPDSPAEVIRQLVNDGVCTKYQGRMLLAGKGRRLVLGKYRLLRPLGKGGGGSVFLGEHTDLRRRVAVKVLRGGSSADDLAVRRFKREARAAAALDHPNLVRLFDFGVAHGVPYLVMEYAAGKTLQMILDRGGPLNVPTAVYVVTQTALGLQHAHTRGIVHRDVKPLNVVVSADGRVKLLDMGLARALDRGEDRLTEQADEGTIAGTLDYMSPEQCNGLAADPRADIYSLGATLFALLSGRPVFQGTPAEKLAKHQSAPPPALDQQVPTVPPALARVVETMLAKRPAERFHSCDEVVAALAPWCPADPPPLGVIDPNCTVNIRTGTKSSANWSADSSRRTVRRRRVGWACGLMLAAAVTLGVGVVALSPPTATADPPHDPWATGGLLLAGEYDTLNEVAFTPDGTRLIGVDWSGAVCVWDTATGQMLHRHVLKAGGAGNNLCLTADGHALVCGTDLPTVRWDLTTHQVAFTYQTRAERTWAAVPSPDGRRVLVTADRSVELRNAATGERERALDSKMAYLWGAAYSADGRRVAACGREPGENEKETGPGAIAIWDADTGRVVNRLGGHIWDVRWVAFHPDGTKLASGGFDNEIRVWDLSTGECLRTFTDANLYVERVHFLPTGRVLSAAACDFRLPEPHTSTVCVWDPDQPQPTAVWSRTFPGRATTVAYSPAAGLYAVANKDKQVWLVKAPPEMTGR